MATPPLVVYNVNPVGLISANPEMDTTSTAVSFGTLLRKTTRTPIFLPPLFWTTRQLNLLRVSLNHLGRSNPQSLGHQTQQLTNSSTSPNNLPTAAIQSDCLDTYWRWCDHGADKMSNYWLFEVVMTVVDYLQKDMRFKSFVKQVGGPGKPGPKLKFWFANTSTALDPEILLSTAGTNVPFLLFSTAAHKHCLRERLANTFRDVCQSRKRIDEVASTKFEIDPFDVACLIAIAQEQAFQFRTSNLPEIPTHFTVYLITPNPLTPASLHLYTAEISRIYLEATENLDIKLEDKLTISREVVEIPSSCNNLREGTLVERLGEILERCHESMGVLQEERDLQRKLAKVRKHVQFWKPIKAGNGDRVLYWPLGKPL